MNSLETGELRALLFRAKKLPSPDRLRLVRMIVATVEEESAATRPSHGTLKDLLGLLKSETPPPNDEECRAILEDELTQKHLK